MQSLGMVVLRCKMYSMVGPAGALGSLFETALEGAQEGDSLLGKHMVDPGMGAVLKKK